VEKGQYHALGEEAGSDGPAITKTATKWVEVEMLA
jgi:hypothetical protein